jgi:hypothetical protein
MQKYPYFTINRVDGGILTKLFKNRKYDTFEDATVSFSKWKDNHPIIDGQYVILCYDSNYSSRICMISEGSTITWID